MSKITSISNTGLRGDGYLVTLDDGGTVEIGVSNFSNCCESWGYMSTPDDVGSFVGAEFLGVDRIGEDLSVCDRCTLFINIKTSMGVLQLTVYNEHNGYYGHDAWIKVNGDVARECVL